MSAPVHVDHFSYALGEHKHSAAESAAAGRTITSAEHLEDAGFRYHHICGPSTTAYDLALAAVRPLQRYLGEVDAIVYATTIPANANVAPAQRYAASRDVKHLMDFPASRLQADLGLDGAFVVGLNQQACTGMLGALRLARSLVTSEPEVRRVLCVTADRFPDGALYEQAYNLISDGAAACVVSAEPAAFRLVAAHQVTNGGLALASDDETVGSYFGYTLRVVEGTLSRAGLEANDIAWVVGQNTHRLAWDVLCPLLRLRRDRVVCPTLPDIGHVIAADNVANLVDLIAQDLLRPGDRLLLVMAGYGMSWQAAVVEYLGGRP